MEIFKLMGSIFVDNAKANESIAKTEGKASGLMSKVGGAIKTVAGVGLAVGAAVGAGATALVGLVNSAASACDRVDKLSAKTGLSKQAFQEWDYVLAQNGASIESLQAGNKTLLSKMEAMTEGNKAATESFNKLNVSVTDSKGKMRDTEDVMNDTIMALAKMENGSEKTRLAQELFGKAGTELLPMLNNGSASIEELTQRAHDLGLVMSDESVNAGVVLGDTMDDVKKSFGAIATQIGVKVMPLVQKMLDWVLEHMPQIQKVMSTVFGVIELVVGTAIDYIGKFIGWIRKISDTNTESGQKIQEMWQKVKEMFSSVFEVIGAAVTMFIDMFNYIWNNWGDTIIIYTSSVFDIFSKIFKTVFDAIRDIFNIFSALFRGDWEAVWNGIKTLFINLWNNIKEVFSSYIEGLVAIFINIKDKIFEAGANMFNALWDGIKGVWDGICNWVTEKVSWIADKLMFWKKSKEEMNDDDNSNYSNSSTTKSVSIGSSNTSTSITNNNYTVNTYSPKTLSAADTAKEFKTATRNLALGV